MLRQGSCKRAAASARLHVRVGECALVWLRGECKRAAENVRLLVEVLRHRGSCRRAYACMAVWW